MKEPSRDTASLPEHEQRNEPDPLLRTTSSSGRRRVERATTTQ